MTGHRRVPVLAGVLVASLAIAGCAGGVSLGPSGPGAAPGAAPLNVAEGPGGGQGALSPAASAAAADVGTVSSSADGAAGTRGAGGAVAAPEETLIVKTGSLVLDVSNLDAALRRAETAVAAAGGYVAGSDRSDQGAQQVATVTYRIPATAWDSTVAAVRAVATKVEKEETNAVEVTGQVIDLGARITNLRATEAALQAIMAKATKIPDVLAVQQQLTDVRGQIEELTAQRQHLQNQAAMGTLTVTFQVPVVAVTSAARAWDPATQVDRASAQLIELAQAAASAGIWLTIVVLPVFLAALAVLVPLAWIGRRLHVRRGPGGEPGEPMWGAGSSRPGA
jgi:hypothetical protein